MNCDGDMLLAHLGQGDCVCAWGVEFIFRFALMWACAWLQTSPLGPLWWTL
jgi:hypothetical protein